MTPYFIQQAKPCDDIRDNNIFTHYNSSDRCIMDEKIINYIINIIYEFCSEKYGHNIKISSYDNFCDQYWKIHEIKIRGWYNIFRVYYFEKKWIEWNIEDYKEEIYNKYINVNVTIDI